MRTANKAATSHPWTFFDAGIPFGGLVTGAGGIKTPEQAAIYGGVAGQPYDPCHHRACDTFADVNLEVLDLNADAIAFAVLQYARNTDSVNGVGGKEWGRVSNDSLEPIRCSDRRGWIRIRMPPP